MKTVLHVGCGGSHVPWAMFPPHEWTEVRLDIDPSAKPDIVGSMTEIPLADASNDAVYSAHCLEHLHEHEVGKALSEFRRVLKEDGFAQIIVPDLKIVAERIVAGKIDETLYESPAGPIRPLDMAFGHQAQVGAHPAMQHKTGFTQDRLLSLLQNSGFMGVNFEDIPGSYEIRARAYMTPGPVGVTTYTKPAQPKPPRQQVILRCTPSLGAVPILWARALDMMSWPFNTVKAFLPVIDGVGGEIAESRNKIVALARGMRTDETDIAKLAWMDDDVIPLSPLILRALDSHNAEICSGVYFSKETFPQPLIFPGKGAGVGKFMPDTCGEFWGCGMGLTLVETSLYDRLEKELSLPKDKYGNTEFYRTTGRDCDMTTENGVIGCGGTEDLYFCDLASKLGVKPVIDMSKHAFGFHYDMKNKVGYPREQWEQYANRKPIVWPNGVTWE